MSSLAGVEEGENTSHPLHGSSTGQNFKVDGDVWHCFRHNTGGSKFLYIAMEEDILSCEECEPGALTGADFIDALEIAAERTNTELDLNTKDRRAYRKKAEEISELLEIYDFAKNYYKKQLSPEIKEWIQEKWGFGEETIEEYDIGYAPNNEELKNKLIEEFGEERAKKSGLLVKLDELTFKSFFQGRVVFPYKHRGKTRYFIARKTPKTPDKDHEKAKYKKLLTHSEKHSYVSEYVEEPVFGLDTTPGSDRVVVTEGITDAISAQIKGYSCISPVTIRFKGEDIQKAANRLRDKEVYVANDNEENQAGFRGALEVLEKLHNESYLVKLPRNEEEEKVDLNDYFRTHDKKEFEALLEDAEWKWDTLAKHKDKPSYYFIPPPPRTRIQLQCPKQDLEPRTTGIHGILFYLRCL